MGHNKWEYTGDVNMLDYGGTFYKQAGQRKFIFIRFENTEDWDGEDWKTKVGYHYHAEVRFVDLDTIPEKELASVRRSMDISENEEDAWVAFGCQEYGLYARLDAFEGNDGHRLLREAKRTANEYLTDEDELENALDKPVNALGSTAREMMAGDIYSAMGRGVLMGNTNACIMAKMSGVPDDVIESAWPEDWLPFFCGYTDAIDGRARESEKQTEISPEYDLGYERGLNVKAGTAKAPTWIDKGVAK